MKKRMERIFKALITLLGFSAVSCFRAEYGCPHADYKMQGEVKSTENVKIPGVRVVLALDGDWTHPYGKDTVYTDTEGRFAKDLGTVFAWDERAEIKFEDPDGEENGGKFKTKILSSDEYTIRQTASGDNKWYGGKFTITANATLEKEN